MSQIGPAAIRAEGVTIAEGKDVLCREISLTVPVRSAYALMGQPRAADAFIQCLAGRRRATGGTIAVLGFDAAHRWKLRSRRLFIPGGGRVPEVRGGKSRPDLMLLANPTPSEETRNHLRRAVSDGMSLFLTTTQAEVAAGLAAFVGILVRGRLAGNGPIDNVVARFRRLRFTTQHTETRTSFGTELDEFDAVRVQVRGWGIEAVVSNFDEAAFERLRAFDGVEDAAVEPMTLAEILEACRVAGD